MKVYYYSEGGFLVIEGMSAYLLKSLVADYDNGMVGIKVYGSSGYEVHVHHSGIKNEDGIRVGNSVEEVRKYLDKQFKKRKFI